MSAKTPKGTRYYIYLLKPYFSINTAFSNSECLVIWPTPPAIEFMKHRHRRTIKTLAEILSKDIAILLLSPQGGLKLKNRRVIIRFPRPDSKIRFQENTRSPRNTPIQIRGFPLWSICTEDHKCVKKSFLGCKKEYGKCKSMLVCLRIDPVFNKKTGTVRQGAWSFPFFIQFIAALKTVCSGNLFVAMFALGRPFFNYFRAIGAFPCKMSFMELLYCCFHPVLEHRGGELMIDQMLGCFDTAEFSDHFSRLQPGLGRNLGVQTDF